MCLNFWSKSLLKKKIHNISFLYKMTSRKKCNMYVTISIFFKKKQTSELSLGSSHSTVFSKNGCPQKQTSRCIFQQSSSASAMKFFEKCLQGSATFSKVASYWFANLTKMNVFTMYFSKILHNYIPSQLFPEQLFFLHLFKAVSVF